MSLKNSNDTIGNGTRDLPVCSVVFLPLRHCAPQNLTVIMKYFQYVSFHGSGIDRFRMPCENVGQKIFVVSGSPDARIGISVSFTFENPDSTSTILSFATNITYSLRKSFTYITRMETSSRNSKHL